MTFNLNRVMPIVAMAATALIAGCGADEEDTTSASATAAPTVAQTVAPPTAAATTPTAAATTPAPQPTPAAPTKTPNACQTSETISNLKFQGVPCTDAAALSAAWEKDQNRCSTIDNPDRPEGYKRTCVLEDYTCQTKRDVKSDARFVACAKGKLQIRFTWAP